MIEFTVDTKKKDKIGLFNYNIVFFKAKFAWFARCQVQESEKRN